MPTTEQLKLLSGLADERSEVALRRLAGARQRLTQARDQLKLLTQYGEDYHARLGLEVSGGMHSDMLRNYQSFMSSVARAIAQQKTEVGRNEEVVRVAEAAWLEARRQLESFRALNQREEARLRSLADRRQQKADDESAARMGLFGLRTSI